MIVITKKEKFKTERLVTHLVTRYVLYIIIIAFVWLQTKELGTTIMIKSYIVLLLGIFSVKVGVFIYASPLIKKPKEEGPYNVIEDEKEEKDESNS